MLSQLGHLEETNPGGPELPRHFRIPRPIGYVRVISLEGYERWGGGTGWEGVMVLSSLRMFSSLVSTTVRDRPTPALQPPALHQAYAKHVLEK